MSQSLRVVKRFRVRELTLASSKARTPPAATAVSILHSPQQPRARAEPSPGSRSSTALNPSVPHKNDKSGRWAPPKYSLRRQAELVKHARASGTLHLLPPGPKMSSAQLLAATDAPNLSTSPSLLSVLGNGRVGEAGAGAEALMVGNGLVDLRRGQLQGQGQGERQEQEGQEGVARGEALARGQDSQDAHAEWTRAVEWTGIVRERNVAGADVGNRLYAGKKRMFKGHKWERTRERRVSRTKMLLRDMDERVQRFKGYRAKGKPLPLARRSNVLKKTQKLPF